MLFRKGITVIDIGTDSIKGVKFKRKRGTLFVDRIGSKSLPYESIEDGYIVDEAAVGNRLNELADELGCRSSKIITTIPNNNLVIRNMELPYIEDEKKMAEALKWESEDHLPYPVESAVQDFKILSRENGRAQILLVAAKSDLIDNIMNVFERAYLTPTVINIQPMALISLVEYQNHIENTVAIVDIGNSGTRVVIGNNHNIYLFRNIDIGGFEFTRIIMEEDNLSYIEAENIKKKNGLPEIEGGIESFELAIEQIALTGLGQSHMLISQARSLADQIGRSLDYYEMKFKSPVDRIYVTGGGAKLAGLINVIRQEIGRELFLLDPFLNIGYRKGIALTKEEFAIAVGLGVSEVLEDEG